MTDIQFPPPSVEDEVLLDGPPGTWLIVWGEYALREVDATGEHLAFISLLNGRDSWADFDLNDMAVADPGIGPGRLMSWIIAMVAVADGVQEVDDMARLVVAIRESSAEKIVSSLHRY